MADPAHLEKPWEIIPCPVSKDGPLIYMRIVASQMYLTPERFQEMIVEAQAAIEKMGEEWDS